jgi:hypothetical protein
MLLEHVYLFTTTRGLMFIVLCSRFHWLKWIVTSGDNLYTCLDRAIKLGGIFKKWIRHSKFASQTVKATTPPPSLPPTQNLFVK